MQIKEKKAHQQMGEYQIVSLRTGGGDQTFGEKGGGRKPRYEHERTENFLRPKGKKIPRNPSRTGPENQKFRAAKPGEERRMGRGNKAHRMLQPRKIQISPKGEKVIDEFRK